MTVPSVLNASFAYDGFGRRARKALGGAATDFLYDGLDIVKETGATGDASYLRTLAIDEAITRADAVGAVHYLADALGSTVALADAAGVLSTIYTYAPFGDSAISGAPSASPFQFTGRENDGAGLYHYRARYYRPLLQRFLSEDPILSPHFNVSSCSNTSLGPNNLSRLRSLNEIANVPETVNPILAGVGHSTWLLPPLLRIAPEQVPQLLSPHVYASNAPVNRRDPNGLMSENACLGVCRVTYAAICSLACEPFLHASPVGWLLCNTSCFVLGEVVCHNQCGGKSHH